MQDQLVTDIVYKNAPPQYRFHYSWTSVVKDLYSQFPSLDLGKPYRQPDYDPSITIPAFNEWIDRLWEKKQAQIQAMRALEKMNAEGKSKLGFIPPHIQPLRGKSDLIIDNN